MQIINQLFCSRFLLIQTTARRSSFRFVHLVQKRKKVEEERKARSFSHFFGFFVFVFCLSTFCLFKRQETPKKDFVALCSLTFRFCFCFLAFFHRSVTSKKRDRKQPVAVHVFSCFRVFRFLFFVFLSALPAPCLVVHLVLLALVRCCCCCSYSSCGPRCCCCCCSRCSW